MRISFVVAPIAMISAPMCAQAASDLRTPQVEKKLDGEIIVTGERKDDFKIKVVQVGAFRNRSIFETPATITAISRELLDAQGASSLDDAMRNVAGVLQRNTSPMNAQTFVARGVNLPAATNYRLNGGLPLITFGALPIENKQRVEMLKGVSALYYGMSSPSGIVNLVTKRAGEQSVTTMTASTDTEGGYTAGLDVGRRFGASGQFGTRINLHAAQMETTVDGVDGQRYLASGAFDWQATDRLAFKLDVEHYRRNGEEQGGITTPSAVGAIGGVGGKIKLPDVPNPHNRYAPASAPFVSGATNALLRADYALSESWSARVEGGIADAHRERLVVNFGAINLATGNGLLSGNFSDDQNFRNSYLRTELAGDLTIFGIRHEILFGFSRNHQHTDESHQKNYVAVVQNLYEPINFDFKDLRYTVTRANAGTTRIDIGAYMLDMAHVTEQLLIIGGVRYVDYRSIEDGTDFTTRTWTPTMGLVYQPTPQSSLYFTYIEGLESAGTAPDEADNAGEVLDPVVSKQIELGARAEIFGAIGSVAYFDIDRGLAYTNSDNVYVLDGRARLWGVEASLQGGLTHNLSISLTGQYLDARQKRTGSAALNGKLIDNSPHWAGSGFVEYHVPAVEGLAVNGGVYFVGKRFVDTQNRGSLPDYTTYSLGGSYSWNIAGRTKAILRINGDNLTSKRYWATGGNTLYVGQTRTVRAAIAIDL